MHNNPIDNIPKAKRGNPNWVPGVSGNPKGAKKKADCLLSCIRAELAKKSANGVSTKEEMIAAALVQMAEKGNLKAIELVLEYTTVKPTQGLELTGIGGKPLEILVKWEAISASNGS